MKRRHQSCTNYCLLVAGTFLVTSGATLYFTFDYLLDFYVNYAMKFDNDTLPFEKWRINDPPLIVDFYMFNWTNSEDLTRPGVKPRFEELGPYRFKEIKEKVNLKWIEENHSIIYQHKTFYHFDAENSVRQLDDLITTVNIVAVAVAYRVRHERYLSKKYVYSFPLSRLSKLFVTKTAGEFIFEGYKDDFLSLVSTVSISGIKDKFGLFYGKNGTVGADGTFEMSIKNDENFGQLVSWNGVENTKFFEGHCGDVKGSAGEFYPINRKKDKITIFSAELCRYAEFPYERDVTIKGVKGYRYSGKNIFDNGSLYPENSCFCAGECLPSGLYNVSTCRQGSPVFLSMPHFYGADPYYLNAVDGMNPNPTHELFITLEPKTGVILNIGLKMQVNILLQPIEGITMFEKMPRIFIPFFYFSQEFLVTDQVAPRLQLLQNAPDYNNIGILIIITLGLLCLIGLGLNVYCTGRRYRSEKYHPPQGREIGLQEKCCT